MHVTRNPCNSHDAAWHVSNGTKNQCKNSMAIRSPLYLLVVWWSQFHNLARQGEGPADLRNREFINSENPIPNCCIKYTAHLGLPSLKLKWPITILPVSCIFSPSSLTGKKIDVSTLLKWELKSLLDSVYIYRKNTDYIGWTGTLQWWKLIWTNLSFSCYFILGLLAWCVPNQVK